MLVQYLFAESYLSLKFLAFALEVLVKKALLLKYFLEHEVVDWLEALLTRNDVL